MLYAVIETGGKQYKVSENDELFVEKLNLSAGESVEFNVVALFDGGKFVSGNPVVPKAKVRATVLKNGKCEKITVFTYKSKKNCKRKQGHRQPYTKVHVDSIVV